MFMPNFSLKHKNFKYNHDLKIQDSIKNLHENLKKQEMKPKINVKYLDNELYNRDNNNNNNNNNNVLSIYGLLVFLSFSTVIYSLYKRIS
jgi:hypothetical protein